jgi:putative DNA methylase
MNRLIEKRLPLTEVSVESAREKSIRHGHISTLHIWWARRPLAASRAAVFATLVPDSDENFELVKQMVPWEAVKDGNNEAILKAREKILAANGGKPPKVLDPFAGGGAIPLEALRLGCETYALDLNPVAHIIQRATLEYPQKYGQPNSRPVPDYIKAKDALKNVNNHQGSAFAEDGEWTNAYLENPLATEVRYWGEWILEKAREELQEFYPRDEDGKTPVAYLWARTVTCLNPACRAEIPLVRQWWLAKKANKSIALKPVVDKENKTVTFEIVEVAKGDTRADEGTMTRDNTTCLVCGTVVDGKNLRATGKQDKLGERMLSVVLSESGKSGKTYRVATDADYKVFTETVKRLEVVTNELNFDGLPALPIDPILEYSGVFNAPLYGLDQWKKLFNARQSLSLVTYVKWIRAAHQKILEMSGDEEWTKGVTTYLGIAHDRLANAAATLCRWDNTRESLQGVYARQALPMVWDYTEGNPIGDQTGSWGNGVNWGTAFILNSSSANPKGGNVLRGSATRIPIEDNFLDAIITDPPYYDAVPYADLSDFFYVWLKRTIGHLYPTEFRTPLTPKAQEAVQNPIRHNGDNAKAKSFFEDMMGQAFKEMHRVLKPNGEATIVFAHKSTDAWETLISALIRAGFRVEASWPLHTEMQTRLRAQDSAALASSTFLNCTKRPTSSSENIGYFNQVRQDMLAAIKPQLEAFWQAGIRGADFFMSAIGPGLESYSKYDEVRRASGETVGVGEFLDEVRKIVLDFALSQVLHDQNAQGRMDEASQFALLALWAYGYELPSDEARKLAQSTGIELNILIDARVVAVKGEKTALLKAAERYKKNEDLGIPQVGERAPILDVLQRAILLLRDGRQAISDYLAGVGYLEEDSFWRAAQAFAEVLHDEGEGRALLELLTLRDNLPKANLTAQVGLFQ